MSDLISRKGVVNWLENYKFENYSSVGHEKEYNFIENLIKGIQNEPTVEAKPVVWKSIAGFEGLYEVSNFGSVRNGKGEIKKQGIKRTTWTCYKTVKLWKDGKYHTKYIHRLIAEAFIPNPDNLPFINHKDEDGTNNSIENLEWCTREYNANYGTAQKKRIKKLKNVPHTEEHKQKISEGLKKHYSENEVWNKGLKMGKRADMRGGKNE